MSETDSGPALVPFTDADGPLELRKGSWLKNSYEVGPEGGPVVRIDASTFRGKERIQTAEGTWTAKSRGAFARKAVITDETTGAEVGRFKGGAWTRGGGLELDGATYELETRGVMTKTSTWRRDGRDLLRVRFKGSFGERKGEVEVTEDGRSESRLGLLVGIALHVELQRRRAGATAGGAAAAGASG